MPDTTNLQVEDGLDALDAGGYHQVVGVDIAGRVRLLVRRGDQQPRRIGLARARKVALP